MSQEQENGQGTGSAGAVSNLCEAALGELAGEGGGETQVLEEALRRFFNDSLPDLVSTLQELGRCMNREKEQFRKYAPIPPELPEFLLAWWVMYVLHGKADAAPHMQKAREALMDEMLSWEGLVLCGETFDAEQLPRDDA